MNIISHCLVHISLFARSLPVVQLDYKVLNQLAYLTEILLSHHAAAVTTVTVIESEGKRCFNGVVSQKYPLRYHTLTLSPHPPITANILTLFVSSSLIPYFLLPFLSLLPLLCSLQLLPLPSYRLPYSSSSLFAPSPFSLPFLFPSHCSQESDAQAVSSEVRQLDLLEAGPAEDNSKQADQVGLFLVGEHDIIQKVFAEQEE